MDRSAVAEYRAAPAATGRRYTAKDLLDTAYRLFSREADVGHQKGTFAAVGGGGLVLPSGPNSATYQMNDGGQILRAFRGEHPHASLRDEPSMTVLLEMILRGRYGEATGLDGASVFSRDDGRPIGLERGVVIEPGANGADPMKYLEPYFCYFEKRLGQRHRAAAKLSQAEDADGVISLSESDYGFVFWFQDGVPIRARVKGEEYRTHPDVTPETFRDFRPASYWKRAA